MVPVALAIAGGIAGLKLGKALIDEDYPGQNVPDSVREEMIRGHVSIHGSVCPRCERRRADLQVDHRIPIGSGGRNSRQNLQILCAECNQKKGAQYGPWEWLTGRYAG